jgi:asparagine synthase (glutamine-hydrolysing)
VAELFGNQMAFPFMDLTLYEFLQKLPVSFKCRGESLIEIAKGHATAKFLLKYHYKPQLPTKITSKKKQGGFAPMPLFFADKKRLDEVCEVIMQSGLFENFLKKTVVEQFLKAYQSESIAPAYWFWYRQNKAIQLFNLYTLALWWKIFMNSASAFPAACGGVSEQIQDSFLESKIPRGLPRGASMGNDLIKRSH